MGARTDYNLSRYAPRLLATLAISLVGLVFSLLAIRSISPVAHAAGVIVVNSTADTTANDGVCTLREAIVAANIDTASGAAVGECVAGSDDDTINFAIIGTADFTISGYDGYTIKPGSALPAITHKVTINGYSQSNATPNLAVSPNPFNGRLLIELDGVNAGAVNGLMFEVGSENSLVKGLVINRFSSGSALATHANSVLIQGNYIGTNPTATAAKPNEVGVNTWGTKGENVLVGGTDPEDRNIISGNTAGSAQSGSYPGPGWMIQGNYIGVGADGVTAIGNSAIGASGGLSIDYADGVLVGGLDSGAANVISGNFSHGIAPDHVTNLTIQGNLIGTDYTGTIPVPNEGTGVTLGDNTNTLIGGSASAARNIISGNTIDGIYLDGAVDISIQGNYIGVGANGTTSIPNIQSTLNITNSNGIVGGSGTGEGNILANSTDGPGVNIYGSSQKVTVLGNSIYNNNALGLDLVGNGVTNNDANDIDTGPNGLLNFPENFQWIENGGNTDIDFDLDVPAGQYRIEFFSNSALDVSGHGEGKTYLGYTNVTSTGSGAELHTAHIDGIGLSNVVATATKIDNQSFSGYGATSEFSGTLPLNPKDRVNDLALSKVLKNQNPLTQGGTATYTLTLTNTGDDVDLAQFDGSGGNPFSTSLFLDLFPSDLTFVSSSNSDVQCVDMGDNGGLLTAILPRHPGYHGLVCVYVGSGLTLADNQMIASDLTFTISNSSSLSFTNFAMAGAVSTDPDTPALGMALTNAYASQGTLDFIDILVADSINNVAWAAYPVPIQEVEDGTSSILPKVGSVGSILSAILAVGIAGGLALRLRFKKP